MNASLILLAILTIIRLWIAVQLFLTAQKSKLSNLYWLAALFALALYSIFTPLAGSPLGNPWIFFLGFIAGHFCLAMFIHTTFYRGRKSPVAVILGLIVLAFFVAAYALSVGNVNLAGIMTVVGLVNWIWHLIVAQSAYSTISADPGVEDWIKARYRLMIIYIVLITGSTIQVVLTSTSFAPLLPTFITPIGILFVIGSIILQFLVWVMPEGFRKWLNRNQQVHTEERIHEQALAILNIIGTAMSEGTGLTKIVCLFAIRKLIGKTIKNEDSKAIEKYVSTLGYDAWFDLLKSPELYDVIKGSSGVSDARKAINQGMATLIDKQSLFTLQSR